MSIAITPDITSAKLPLGATIVLAYASLFTRFVDLLRLSWVWLVACALLSAMANWLKISHAVDILRRGGSVIIGIPRVLDLALLAAFLLAGISIALAWHRVLILHEAPKSNDSNIATGRAWRYIGTALQITLMVGIPSVFVMTLVFLTFLNSLDLWGMIGLIVPIVYLIVGLIGSRISMMLPAQAVDDRTMTPSAAWAITRGNSWRMFWGYVACTLPPLLLALLVLFFAVGPDPEVDLTDQTFVIRMTAIKVVNTLYYLLILPIPIGFLSHAYRHFTGRA